VCTHTEQSFFNNNVWDGVKDGLEVEITFQYIDAMDQ